MRKLFLILPLLSVFQFAFAQSSDKDLAAPDEDYGSYSKVMLSEELEQKKVKIEKIRAKLDELEKVKKGISDYLVQVKAFTPENAAAALTKEVLAVKADEYYYFEVSSKIQSLSFSSEFITLPYESENRSYLTRTRTAYEAIPQSLSSAMEELAKTKPLPSEATIQTKIETILKDGSTQLQTNVEAIAKDLDKDISDRNTEMKNLSKQKEAILEALNRDESINGLAIRWGLPMFCGTIFLLFVSPSLIRYFRARLNPSTSNEANDRHSQNVLLEISTVLLVTMSILILGLSGKIDSQVLGTLLGGISGYVLNRVRNTGAPTPGNGKAPKEE